MNKIKLRLKTYDELVIEITKLQVDNYLLKQEIDKYKSIVDKATKYIEENTETDYLEYYSGYKNVIESENILGILKEVKEGNSNE